MASILDRYGIKEVADVTFYEIDKNTGGPAAPVLYLDTLKVSTIEQTAESVYAQGGKGNAKLIGWDFGKEITLNIEDALFSPKSMAIMFGNGKIANHGEHSDSPAYGLVKTIMFHGPDLPSSWTDGQGNAHAIDPKTVKVYSENGKLLTDSDYLADTKGESTFFAKFVVKTPANSAREIVIGPNTFPGTYYITGDTFARAERTGKDQFFQFIIPKGKITSENTITLEAEGDPSVFNMTVEVMRATVTGIDASGKSVPETFMMKLVQYELEEGTGASGADTNGTNELWDGEGTDLLAATGD